MAQKPTSKPLNEGLTRGNIKPNTHTATQAPPPPPAAPKPLKVLTKGR
jgi:hypothetical protein